MRSQKMEELGGEQKPSFLDHSILDLLEDLISLENFGA